MKFGIVVDSGCDIDSINIRSTNNIGFEKVPLKILIGTSEYSDGIGFENNVVFEALKHYKGKTSTAAPSAGEWFEAFCKYDAVFAVTITSSLSGSFASAEIARKIASKMFPEKKIEVIDSLSTGPEMTLIAEKLCEYIEQGFNFDEIVEKIRDYQKHTRLLYALESVDNLVNNGRVSKLEGKLVRALELRLLGRASIDGRLELLQKCRGKIKLCEKIIHTMLSDGYSNGKIIISHCQNNAMAENLKKKISDKCEKAKIIIMNAKGLNSYYAEKGGLLVGYETPIAR